MGKMLEIGNHVSTTMKIDEWVVLQMWYMLVVERQLYALPTV